MLIKTIPVGQLEENCYVVTNEATLESVVIDPGDEANTILDYLDCLSAARSIVRGESIASFEKPLLGRVLNQQM